MFWSHPDTSVQIVSPPETAAAKSLQSCLTLCDPIDDSPPGSTVPEILQARTLEWVAISFSNASSQDETINKDFCLFLKFQKVVKVDILYSAQIAEINGLTCSE